MPIPVGEQDEQSSLHRLRSEAWDRAIYAAGTAYIFEIRVAKLRRKIKLLTFFGFAAPLAVGLLVLGYGLDAPFLPVVLPVTIAAAAVQLVIALWASLSNWSEDLERSVRSLLANEALRQRFEDLGRTPPESEELLRHGLDVQRVADEAQRQQDHVIGVSAKDKRRGMRAGLLRYVRPCASCKEVPTTMKPTKCGVCGDF
ncbi:hypothetical protein O2W15_02135 [Modestobacter sp. VKM Ac-2979]|uniref:mobilome CxxCx(11)CxxC protein n=1 Tax=unclassified Modestobacter TaxID=2643866 RepID=UPI0022AB61E9|nr:MULTISPECIES: mobilome CxxCx(11)CxxC protein [unclassified Modestobacter]MCZ2810225.1 hypothetical protein [Modestobacter sp. VKM Ac-2979]MCZ2841711.1 hypothetical protein [Modestobacter sp. VKM Ac-2980]